MSKEQRERFHRHPRLASFAKSAASRNSCDDVDHGGRSWPSDFLLVGGGTDCRDIFLRLKLDPKNPNGPENDRFVLSKGHAAPLLYVALADRGVFPVLRAMTLRQFSSDLEDIQLREFLESMRRRDLLASSGAA